MRKLTLIFSLLILTFLSVSLAQEKEVFNYDEKSRRDPFMPLVDEDGRFTLEAASGQPFSELELAGILWDPKGRSSALISGEMVKVGETICGFQVKSITKESVIFTRDGKDYTLRVTLE